MRPRFRMPWRLLVISAATFHYAVTSARPFTVRDAIEMTEIAEPQRPYTFCRMPAPEFLRSPDDRHFIAVTRRGNFLADQNEYSLLLFDANYVREVFDKAGGSKLPAFRVIETLGTSNGDRAIEQVRWHGDNHLVFIGRHGANVGQVYSLDLTTRKLKRLTNHEEGIVGFDIAPNGNKIVFAAPIYPDWSERNRKGYVVRDETISELTITDPRRAAQKDVGFYLQDQQTQNVRRLALKPITMGSTLGSEPTPSWISVSPNGRWAVVLATAAAVPSSWREYDFLKDYLSGVRRLPGYEAKSDADVLRELASDEPLAPRSSFMKQFFLVDTTNGHVRPLVDAPTGSTGVFMRILWSRDSKRVVLTPTYMPLAATEGIERDRRKSRRAVIEVEVGSGHITRITDVGVKFIVNVQWMDDGSIRLESASCADSGPAVRRFVKRSGEWQEAVDLREGDEPRLGLQVTEDLNTPQRIEVVDHKTRRHKVLAELNPQLRDVTLGRVEVFNWKDKAGRSYKGGLVKPPGFRAGKRYPVVLQTDGFRADEFLVDGPLGMSTAYAARPIANKGMLVLQMPEGMPRRLTAGVDWGTYQRDGELPRFVAMMESAIDALDKRGLIDRARVGLIGFSREGMHVQYAITFSKYPIAAATISSSVQATPFSDVTLSGQPYPAGMFEMETIIGAPFWGEGVWSWMERSPAFHLDRIQTPLRIEHLGTAVPEYWDTYAYLKRHGRPVEMIHLPLAGHLLERPADRYMSQQGNVDWYAFWLKGEEDPDPAKADQYKRWRILRAEKRRVMVGDVHDQ